MSTLQQQIQIRENLRESENHLEVLVRLMPQRKELKDLLKEVRKDLRAVEKCVGNICSHTSRTEGPHGVVWCNLCGDVL